MVNLDQVSKRASAPGLAAFMSSLKLPFPSCPKEAMGFILSRFKDLPRFLTTVFKLRDHSYI